MAGRCGSCNKSSPSGYLVTRPGLPDRTVSNESAALSLVKGIPGAGYTPIPAKR